MIFAMRFTLGLLIAIPLFLFAQDPPPAGGAPKGGPRPAPKNLKLLKPDEVRPTMGAFRVALGQQCTFCHMEGDFASDDNPKKNIARTMITMTREINAKVSGAGGSGAGGSDASANKVTCYTCHRGDQHPVTAPPAAAPPAAE